MSDPIPFEEEQEWQVRICRPAFQDFHMIFSRYYARSVLNRQLLKLRWWNPDQPQVVDLQWDVVPDTGLCQLVVEPSGVIRTGVRVIFLEHSADPAIPTLWVLGGTRIDDELSDLQKMLFVCRSMIVKERAD
ncbi:MAG: hypothetical protein KDA91_11155 [Planctomycetaceae bacterium]|nr:hypothetical protein [Planctomycetaceae bacterium]